MADRTFNVEDRIRELGEDPATAYANAKAEGMAGDAPPPAPIGPTDPALAPSELGVAPALDPDAALHHAAPGKFKPAAAAAPAKKAPPLAPIADTGTLADTQEQMPDLAPVRPTAAPIEPPASFGELFHAHSSIAQRDNTNFDEHMIAVGYAPIVRALGLDPSENPAAFGDLDAAGQARFGSAGSPSRLATAAHQGEQVPFANTFLADRSLQESLIVAEIKKRRATQPDFLKGVPDTVAGIRSYFLQQQRQGQAADEATVGRSPGGVTGFAAALGGSVAGTFHDPMNIAALAIPGGEGKTLIHIAARDALINGVLELGQQPIVAHNRAELGESYTVGDAIENTFSAAAGGAAFGGALHVAGKAAAATGIPQAIGSAAGNASSAVADRLFAALPETLQKKWGAGIVKEWTRRLDNGEKLEDVFSELSNRELTTLSRTIVGEQHLTPDERAAANVLDRAEEVGESSPYQPGPAGDATHENGLASAIKDLEDRRKPEATGVPSDPVAEGSGAAAPAPAPARPPAALSTARRPQPSTTPEAAIESFKAKTRGAESSGNDQARNGASSAEGRYQITDGTFRGYYKRLYGEDPGEHPSDAIKFKADVQERIMDALTRDNAAALQHGGEAVSEGNLYLAHFLGSHDALRVLKADASTPIDRVLSEKVLEANPFLRGKSTSQVAAWAHTKMDRYYPVASVAPRGDAGALDAASEDPTIAQLRDEALRLDDAVIGSPSSSASSAPPPMYARSFNVDDITVDAHRFQFKGGGDELGVTDRLRGVKEWNPLYSGRVVVWEDKDGAAFLADGHQRHGLARRIQAETGAPIRMDAIVLREADGITAEDARIYSALKNIAEGTGTSVDAAKVFRGAGEHVLEHLPPKSALVRDGRALASLSDAAFGAVYNDVVPADFAAVIGHLLPDRPEAHEAMIDLLAKLDPANRGQAESIVRQAMAAGLHKEEQVDLFGTHSHVTSLMLERAKVLEKVLANLRKSKLVFKTAAKEADALEAVGSKIAKSASEKEAQANAQALEIVSRLAFSRGAVADALNDAAAKLAAGAKLADVADEAARAIKGTDLGALAREAAGDDASRLVPDGAGRGGDAGEEGPQSPSQSGDQEQPSLVELEHATERFSDPDGPAVKQQAESLVHDAKAPYNRADFTDEHADTLPNPRKDWRGVPDADVETAQGPDGLFHFRASYNEGGSGFASPFAHHGGFATREEARAAGFRYLSDKAGKASPRIRAWIDEHTPALTRRDRIKAATAELEKAKPGELRTVEPFPDEPGYHRFRYIADDGTMVGGNYTLDKGPPPFIEGFNVGDTNSPVKLGPKQVRKLFAEIQRQHPEATRIHAFRMTGARPEAKEMWIDLAGKGDGVKPEDVDVHAGEPPAAAEPAAAGNSRELGALEGGEIQKSADAADKELTGKAADAIDRFIGHGPMSRDKEGSEGVGIMSARDLERAISENGETAAEIEKAFAPVRASIEAKTGPTVRLYRAQQPVDWDPGVHYGSRGDDRQRAVLSWTSDPKFADHHAGVDPRRDRPDVSEEEIARAEKQLEETGRADVGKGRYLERDPDGAIQIYDDAVGGHVTDTDSVRDYFADANRYRAEDRASNAKKREAVISAEVPLKDVVWVTDRAGQSEFIVRNKPGADWFVDEHGKLSPGAADKPTLDLGEQTDPNIAETNRQLVELGAAAPLRPEGIDRVAAEDMARSFRLGDEGDEITLEDLLKDLDDDDKAIKAMKDCL